MRIVVTGALGHIGSRLIRELAVAWPGVEVVMIDNLATERYASLFNLPDGARYEFVEGDVLTSNLHALFTGADAVVHLAALTNGARTDLRARMELVNVDGTERVAKACASMGIGLLFPSTTSVYGVPHGIVTEDCPDSDLSPQSPYAEWKLRSEDRLRSLEAQQGLRFVIFRMGTIFGPSVGMRFHTAVNQFCWRAVARQPLAVWTTASHQFRPYLDLTDAVRAMIFMLRRDQFDGRVYNVLTVNATVTHVIDVLRLYVPDLAITYVDSPLMNDLSYCVDDQRLARLGFEVRGSLESGIGKTIAMLNRLPMAQPKGAS
ncbi:MAG TPA: NAD-dependent epimerase/dehydratase [Vicinamibacterales bacterium]|nr:NAD-dependent epimerase/dehydratase [Vicinamibacterales bacterium]